MFWTLGEGTLSELTPDPRSEDSSPREKRHTDHVFIHTHLSDFNTVNKSVFEETSSEALVWLVSTLLNF